MTNDCSNTGYYYTKYCGQISQIVAGINDSAGKVGMADQLIALEQRLANISKNPPEFVDVHAPGVVSLSTLLDKEADSIMAFINFLFALFNEIGAIFGWYAVGYSSNRIPRETIIVEDNFNVDTNVSALSVKTDNRLLTNGSDIMTGYVGGDDKSAELRAICSAKLKALLDKMDHNSASFAKAINVPSATFNDYLAGKRLPPITLLLKIKKHLHGNFNIDDFLSNDAKKK
jgi:DNA-binding XRE family transcriptional regulator